jgi:alpha-L-fucosidase 2
VRFLVEYMQRSEATGVQWGDDKYHIFPTVVPELYGLTPGLTHNADCLADLTLTRFVFNAYLQACRILEIEPDERPLREQVQAILGRFPPYPTAASERGQVFVSVAGEDPEIVYNVPVPTMAVFPGEDIGFHSDPDTLATAVNTYHNQQNEGGNDLVFLNLQAARLGQLDLDRFKRQIDYCLLPNGTCTNMVQQTGGRYHDETPFDFMAPMGVWLENFALPAVINECLLQSYTGVLRLFPNWPTTRRAEFRTLRAVGAFLVSGACSNGAVDWIEVFSETGTSLQLINPWSGPIHCVRSGRESILTGDLITLDTEPGETLRFVRSVVDGAV